MSEERPDDLTPAAFAENEFAAQTKAAVLRDAGIEAIVPAGELNWTGGLLLQPRGEGVPVLVRRHDEARAKEVLARCIADSVDLDWNEVDLGDEERSEGRARPFGRMPLAAQIAWIVTALALALGLLAGVINLFP